jgi:hypothetical protein
VGFCEHILNVLIFIEGWEISWLAVVGFEDFTAVFVRSAVIRVVTPFSSEGPRRFEEHIATIFMVERVSQANIKPSEVDSKLRWFVASIMKI